jgi:hypothetical protein
MLTAFLKPNSLLSSRAPWQAMSWLGGHVHGEHCKHGHGEQQQPQQQPQQQHNPALAHTIFAPPSGAEDLGPSQRPEDSVLTTAPGAESTDAGETEVCMPVNDHIVSVG